MKKRMSIFLVVSLLAIFGMLQTVFAADTLVTDNYVRPEVKKPAGADSVKQNKVSQKELKKMIKGDTKNISMDEMRELVRKGYDINNIIMSEQAVPDVGKKNIMKNQKENKWKMPSPGQTYDQKKAIEAIKKDNPSLYQQLKNENISESRQYILYRIQKNKPGLTIKKLNQEYIKNIGEGHK